MSELREDEGGGGGGGAEARRGRLGSGFVWCSKLASSLFSFVCFACLVGAAFLSPDLALLLSLDVSESPSERLE